MDTLPKDTLPKVSVIIPVYNTAPYLRACLDSVINQPLREVEVICVDDGSTDDSPAILAEYAAADNRIRLLRQENAGQSAARNAGTALARGRYIYYLDSDDALHTNALARLYEKSEEYRLDILFFDAEVIYQTEALREQFQHAESYYHTID